jgi:Transcriptional regulatory protein, C terminal
MELRLLGPFDVLVDAAPHRVAGRGERALLALSPGKVVATSTLIDALWGEDNLPEDPGNALQLRVSKLRRALGGLGAPDLVMSLYGGMSKGERNRIKIRVRTAMASQASTEGRFLGGRPPYGYQLADAGPHPNPAKAAIGQRLHRLETDPVAAPVVLRIADYLAVKVSTRSPSGSQRTASPAVRS